MKMGIALFLGTAAVVGICVYSYFRYKRQQQPTSKSESPATNSQPRIKVHTESTRTINQIAARNVFIKNINRFIPLLPSLTDGTYDQKETQNQWDDEIIDINNFDLINLWHIVRKNSDTVKHILAQWGLTPDLCTKFQCMPFHISMYESVNGEPITVGTTYGVEVPCWILTAHIADGKTEKKVIKKGKVK